MEQLVRATVLLLVAALLSGCTILPYLNGTV